MELWGFKATLIVNRVVTDRSGVLPFCPNQTEQVKKRSVCRTARNRTKYTKNTKKD